MGFAVDSLARELTNSEATTGFAGLRWSTWLRLGAIRLWSELLLQTCYFRFRFSNRRSDL